MKTEYGLVAQPGRASDLQSEGHGFKSHRGPHVVTCRNDTYRLPMVIAKYTKDYTLSI